ncbi:MAG TPA: response regulator [Virgibacillus sp.]|nr:response regulator [Virgibacillus sp.]
MTKHKILVVDDQPGIRLLLTEIFTHKGYEVSTAKTGREALDKINARSFDLVILDYKLPILDGLEVIKQLEQQDCTIPLILMSGLTEQLSKQRKESRLIKKIVSKPFDVQKMSTLVQSMLT